MSIVINQIRNVAPFAATVLAIASIMFSLASVQHPNSSRYTELVPSSIGTYWMYEGNSREQIGKKIEDRTWQSKQSVLDSIKSAGVSASLVEEDTKTEVSNNESWLYHRTFIRLVFDNSRYYEEYESNAEIRNIWRSLKDKIASGEKPAEPDRDSTKLISLQMKVPSRVGSELDNGMDRWCVEKIVPLKPGTQIGKFSIPQETTEYSIASRTASEDYRRTFIPGIGFTASSYAHHAKIKFTDEQMVEFHPANP